MSALKNILNGLICDRGQGIAFLFLVTTACVGVAIGQETLVIGMISLTAAFVGVMFLSSYMSGYAAAEASFIANTDGYGGVFKDYALQISLAIAAVVALPFSAFPEPNFAMLMALGSLIVVTACTTAAMVYLAARAIAKKKNNHATS